jgi:hypothetical protein
LGPENTELVVEPALVDGIRHALPKGGPVVAKLDKNLVVELSKMNPSLRTEFDDCKGLRAQAAAAE